MHQARTWYYVLALALLARCGSDATTGSGGLRDLGVLPVDEGLVSSDTATVELPPSGDASPTSCTGEAIGCSGTVTTWLCVNGVRQFGTMCGKDAFCLDGRCAKPATCKPGENVGCDGVTYRLVCTADGKAAAAIPCASGLKCVAGECKQVACTPGIGQCATKTSVALCKPDGSGFGAETACDEGKTCVGGHCVSLCEADIKYNTNVGCEYWSVDLDNDPTHNPAFPAQPTPEMFPHSVVISNPGKSSAVMTFTVHVGCADGSKCTPSVTTCNNALGTVCGTPAQEYDLAFADNVVPAGQSREFKMPVMNVSGSVVAPKAIRIMASSPVVASQFNPFNSENAASNDGSLLLPRNALGKLYFAVSLPSRGAITDLQGNPWFPANNGFLAVVATAAATTVQVTPTVDVLANPTGGVPQGGATPKTLVAGQTYVFTLERYDVLNLEQEGKLKPVPPGKIPDQDLTGTRIEADKAVVVFSGHQVAGIQEAIKSQFTDEWDSCCTEHLEEQLMPVETWGTEALCVKSKPRGQEMDRWVIVAGDDAVTLKTVPSIDGLDGTVLAKAGDGVRVETKESFTLTATGRIQVVQFLMSQGQTQPKSLGAGPGDPTMMLIPPSKQYREEYVIQTAEGFGANWTTVIRPKGATVTVDGVAVANSDFEAIGSGAWEFAYREVAKGVHTFKSDTPFGLMVYGYGGVTAYGYPGGMKLEAK